MSNELQKVKEILVHRSHDLKEWSKTTYSELGKAHDKQNDTGYAVIELERKLKKAKEKHEEAKDRCEFLSQKYYNICDKSHEEQSAKIKALKLLKENPHITISEGTDFSVQVYEGEWVEDLEYHDSWKDVLDHLEFILTPSN